MYQRGSVHIHAQGYPAGGVTGIIYIYILAWTCAYPCTGFCGSDHVETLQLCCRSCGLSSVSCLCIFSLYLVLFLVWQCLCTGHSGSDHVVTLQLSGQSDGLPLASCPCILFFFVWQSIRSRKLSGLASCQEAVRSQVWEAAMEDCQVPGLGSS